MTRAQHVVSRLLEEEQMEMFEPEEMGRIEDLYDPEGFDEVNTRRPRITTTYAVYTPESVAEGGAEETGWEDEEGVSMEPDEWDKEEGKTPVDLAVDFLERKGAMMDSSSHFNPGAWYTSRDEDFRTAKEVEYNYHLEEFTEEEEKQIWQRMHGR